MRDSGRISTGPNFEKSWAGTSGMPVACAAGPVLAGAAAGPRTPVSRSSLVMRPFGPLPDAAVRSTPSSRASRRTPGPACTPSKSAGAPASTAVTGALVSVSGGGTASAARPAGRRVESARRPRLDRGHRRAGLRVRRRDRLGGPAGRLLRRGDGVGGLLGSRLLLIGQRRRPGKRAVGIEKQDGRPPADQVAGRDPELADRSGRR